MSATEQPPAQAEPAQRTLERRLARERHARLEAETIAERVTSELYATVQELTRSTKLAQLLAEVAATANAADCVSDAMRGALASVCAYSGWPVGHALVRAADQPDTLVSCGAWHLPDPERFGAFHELSERTRFTLGLGLPGRTMQAGEPTWIPDLGADPNFPRAEAAAACGLAAGFAIPVLVRSETVAVLEFFTTQVQPPDAAMLRMVAFVGTQLGRVIERDVAEQQLTRQALHDALTGLGNRALFIERVNHALAVRERAGESSCVLYLDLDDFKTVNDALGHSVGDQLLVEVARRLREVVRASDMVARLGGDEFAMLLEATTIPQASEFAARLLAALRAPLHIDGKKLLPHASIGIACSDHAERTDDLLRHADIAMYAAKRQAKGTYQVFRRSMLDTLSTRIAMKGELDEALEQGQFVLHYQPIVDLRTGRGTAIEALVRWNHPERGMLFPDAFISLLEETGQIAALGAWVIDEALRQAAALQRSLRHPLGVCINLSASQLEIDLVGMITDSLRHSGLAPEQLTLEITETCLMSQERRAVEQLDVLRALGIRTAIDDFGTGYSSLEYLKRLPIDTLKIDRSFVQHITEGPEESALAHAIVKLADIFGLQTVAEGVETTEQHEILQEFGCHLGQGYLFARPAAAADISLTQPFF